MAEPTVPVPMSQARQLLHALESLGLMPTAQSTLRALLSQPNPTAEAVLGGLPAPDHDDKACYYGPCVCGKHSFATPPSIADMAPGTTFTARFTWTEDDYQFKVGSQGRVSFHVWEPMPRLDRIDPSTIRDVTPPKDAA